MKKSKTNRSKPKKKLVIDPVDQNSVPIGMPRNPVQIALDQKKIFQLLRRGYDVEQIADAMNLGIDLVRDDYKRAIKEYVKNNTFDCNIEETIALKLSEYAEIKQQAWLEWERSKNKSERRAYEKIKTPNFNNPSEPFEKTVAKKFIDGRLGGSEYLRIIMDCIKAERELLGLDPSKSLKLKGTLGGVEFDWDLFMDEVNQPNLRREVEDRIYDGLPRIEVQNESKQESE